MRTFIFFISLLCAAVSTSAQRMGVYAYSRAQGAYMTRSDVNTMIDYYNQVNKTTLNTPNLGAGYKVGFGWIALNWNIGMSQHEHYLSSQGTKDELPNGYRLFDIKHRSRNGVVGLITKKGSVEHQFNIEGGIGRSVITTGFAYNDGFVSYGPESTLNGSYWVRSFQLGAEYVYQKNIKNNWSVTGGLGFHNSKPLAFGRFEDQMDYKRGGNYYVLYKAEPAPGGFQWDDPAHVMAKYSFLSLTFGVQYNIELSE